MAYVFSVLAVGGIAVFVVGEGTEDGLHTVATALNADDVQFRVFINYVIADVFQFNVLHDVKLAVALPRGTEFGWPCRILQECDSVEVFQMNV